MPEPTPKLVTDPAIQAVFDALDAFIAGTTSTNATSSVTQDGTGTTHTISSSGPSSRYTYTEWSAGSRVTVQPTSASLGPGQTQQFSATAVDATGAAIATPTFTWSVATGAQGTVDATGLYTAPAAIVATVAETLTATLSGDPAWTAVTVQLHP